MAAAHRFFFLVTVVLAAVLTSAASSSNRGKEDVGVIDPGLQRASQQRRNRNTPRLETPELEPYIVEGETVNRNNYKWIVKTSSPFSTCTASLIHSDLVLTAAHCHGVFGDGVFISPNAFDGRNAIFRKVIRQYRHPGYNFNSSLIANDLLILRLEEPVRNVVPVVLNADPDVPSQDDPALRILGFGLTSFEGSRPNRLQQADVEYVKRDICDFWASFFRNVQASEGILCAGAPDGPQSTCNGDSGGPLILRNPQQTNGDVQVGITSFGRGCESFPTPNGFTRISYFYDWIQEQICLRSAEPPEDCPEPDPPHPFAVEVNITLQYDVYPSQTTWAIRDQMTKEIVFAGPIGVPTEFSLWWTTLVLPPGDYTFELYDAAGDGLVGPFLFGTFKGWHEIRVEEDGKPKLVVPRTLGDFDSVQFSDFVVPGPRSAAPSPFPSQEPSNMPTQVPSLRPSAHPSETPSAIPSSFPSALPSASPSEHPSALPSQFPSDSPSAVPSVMPSSVPSVVPSVAPSTMPSDIPSDTPSVTASDMPSGIPSNAPSDLPSQIPTTDPTSIPTTSAAPSDVVAVPFADAPTAPRNSDNSSTQNPSVDTASSVRSSGVVAKGFSACRILLMTFSLSLLVALSY